MAPTHCHGWLRRPPSSGFQLSSSAPSLRSSLGLAAEACMNLEAQGLRRKMKWQSGKGGSTRCGGVVIKHSPTFCIQGFLGNRSTICTSLNSSKQRGGPLPGLSRNYSPYRPFIATICYCPPNIRRLLRHLLWLSNYYCTSITLVFSPGFVFFKISSCGLGTASALRLGSSLHWGLFSIDCYF